MSVCPVHATRERAEKKGAKEGTVQLFLIMHTSSCIHMVIIYVIEQEAATDSSGGSAEDEGCRSDAEGD